MTDSPAAARPHRARRGVGERLRGEVMDAAEALLLEHGSQEAVSMRAIAKTVGVTPPAIYLHFDTKEELFFAVCDRRFNAFTEAVVRALEDAGPDASPIDQLYVLGRAYVNWGLANPEHYAILFGGAITLPEDVDPMQLQGRQSLEALLAVLRRGKAEGAFTFDDEYTAALTMWAAVHGFVELATFKQDFVPDIDVRSRLDAMLDLLLGALLA
ncbi:MAG TPA: TetR/AcrR family transcriptional regulator [Egicoccus sp.]|nr:TetR/AcrR family transcriptional regulator [Egicoccus sp.]HSK23774.1 TetR/AcrR family transcriptional regulator [Egicoccus sp.]